MKQFDAMKRLASIEGRLTLLIVLAYSIGGLLGLLLGSPSPVYLPVGLALSTLVVARVGDNPRRLGARHLPVIALSAGVLPEEREAAHQAGMHEFLAKPLDFGSLVSIVFGSMGAGAALGRPDSCPTLSPCCNG